MFEGPRADVLLATWAEEACSRRACERTVLCCPASLTAAGRRYRGEIWDVSPLGALVRLNEAGALDVGDRLIMMPRGYQSVSGEVRHVGESGLTVGLMLRHDAAAQARFAKWLDAQRTVARRQSFA